MRSTRRLWRISPALQLLLIRHATNDWVPDRLAGWTPGVHLNDEGRAQASAVAQRLTGCRIDAVYASPLERAMETAAFVAMPHDLPVLPLQGVGELRLGELEGRSLKELSQHPLWGTVQHTPSLVRLPGGESFTEMQARAVAAIEGLRESHPRDVVAVVSHGDVIKAILAHYGGLHLDMFQRLVVEPASISAVQFTEGPPRLILLNDTGAVPQPPDRDHGAEPTMASDS